MIEVGTKAPSGPKDIIKRYASSAKTNYNVQTSGRPGRSPRDAAVRTLRRQAFGIKMKSLREDMSLTLSEAALIAGITSPRKLAQYETTCYPPGDVILKLAPHYNVSQEFLCYLVLEHSDPDMFLGITGITAFTPSEAIVDAYLKGEI